jgi:hypothetical protein
MSPQPDHAEPSPPAGGTRAARHLIITVHGIRTFGQWQERLEKLLPAEEGLTVKHYHYGYFSVIAFILPFLRWLTTRRFRRELLREAQANPGARIDLVAHSFGTHLVAWALLGLPKDQRPHIHTIILAGGVLKVGFSWRVLMDDGKVRRIVNDCGTNDRVLLLNQLCVLFTGMAGRVGFNGMTERERFLNRYFRFGHSGYFERDGLSDDEFMREKWVPLLAADRLPEPHDEREPGGALRGVELFLLNNAEPVKLTAYLSLVVALLLIPGVVYYRLWQRAEKARDETERTAAVGLLRPLMPQPGGLTPREVEALTQLATLPKSQERIRIRFIEEGLSDPGRAVRLANRTPAALQAAVGLDPARRAKVADILRKYLGDAKAHLSVRVAAAMGVAELGLKGVPLNEQAARALLEVVETRERPIPLYLAAQGIALTTRSLPAEQRADFRGPAFRALADALGRETDLAARQALIAALMTTAEGLPPEAAAKLMADALGQETIPSNRWPRAQGLAEAAKGLPPAAAAKVLADALGKETSPFARQALAGGLAAAAGGLSAEERDAFLGPAARKLADALGQETAGAARQSLAAGLAAVAGGLPPQQRGAFLGPLADALGKETDPFSRSALAVALAAVVKGQPPETAIKPLADALGKKSDGRDGSARQALAGGLAAAATGLSPEAAIKTLAGAIGKEPFWEARRALTEALVAAAKRLPPAAGAKALADALGTNTSALPQRTFVEALAALAGGLSAEERDTILGPAARKLADALGQETDRIGRAVLAERLVTAAKGLPPEQRAAFLGPAARALADALGKETGAPSSMLLDAPPKDSRLVFAEGLATAAEGLPSEQRDAILGPTARALADALGNEIFADNRPHLAAALVAVSKGLPSATTASTLAAALDKESDGRARQALAKGLAAAAEGLPPSRSTSLLLRYIASYEELYEILAPALRASAQRCSLAESVEALKHPFCFAEERGVFGRRVEQLLIVQTFGTHWEMVEWLRQNHPEIDLSAPPRLEEQPDPDPVGTGQGRAPARS